MYYDEACNKCGSSLFIPSRVRSLVEFLTAPLTHSYRCAHCGKRQTKLRLVEVPITLKTPRGGDAEKPSRSASRTEPPAPSPAPTASVSTGPRKTFLPYCLPQIGEEEIAEVVDTLRSGWITTGPKVKRLEREFAAWCGAEHAIAVSSCTAAMHVSLAAMGIGAGDEVLVPTMTFCATANVVVHLGATPVLIDTTEDLLFDVAAAERALTPRTRAIIPVHYAGLACDLDAIHAFAARHNLYVVEDAAHATGTEYKGRKIGAGGRAVCFSFYATKNLSTGEGGMITTNDAAFAAHCRSLSLHGISRDAWDRYTAEGSWQYEVTDAGFKANMTDLEAAIGIHQLAKIDSFNQRRIAIADQYDEAFTRLAGVVLPRRLPYGQHCFHLYPLQLTPGVARVNRNDFIDRMRQANIGCSVHFIPLHRHPFYASARFGYRPEQFPVSDAIYQGLVSLPLYPKMTRQDVHDVIAAVRDLLE